MTTPPTRAPLSVVPRPYGDDDQIGAADEIGPDTVAAAARLVAAGRRYALGQVLRPGSPHQMWRYWKHTLLTDRTAPERGLGSNRQTFVEEAVSGALHSGTHLDGLGHIGIGAHAYGGRAWHDIVLLHTGWGAYWDADGDRYARSEPGLDLAGARWLLERRVTVIGADTRAVERVPLTPGEEAFPVRQGTITRSGVYLMENVRTAELAADGVHAFLCVVAPLRLQGASGSMVNPVAVV